MNIEKLSIKVGKADCVQSMEPHFLPTSLKKETQEVVSKNLGIMELEFEICGESEAYVLNEYVDLRVDEFSRCYEFLFENIKHSIKTTLKNMMQAATQTERETQ
jgi:hypothetical protein